jgi:hypothetical protein
MFLCGFDDVPSCCHRNQCRRLGLKCVRDGVGVEERNSSEEFRVPAGQCCLASAVGASNKGQYRRAHREGEADFFWRSAIISCSRFFSMATPARAACAIFCAIWVRSLVTIQGYSNKGFYRTTLGSIKSMTYGFRDSAGCRTHSRSLRTCGCWLRHFTRGFGEYLSGKWFVTEPRRVSVISTQSSKTIHHRDTESQRKVKRRRTRASAPHGANCRVQRPRRTSRPGRAGRN